ncbi:hypothetical protein MKW98_008855 [Papaver atlanticum]|uniref:TF-B3 domain-containing protein n=1 Tax=Papaver atlanticum TaxID=357466 RepID=A0AAD4XA46_9MAGN|nr:hypothetical protein MKW98_008855 [Papaver atlanticum]
MTAADKAEEIRASLDPEFPSLVKIMIRSSVSGGFWLGLPSRFCSSSLPKKDTKFTLVDEDGEAYTAKYLPRRFGLSGGWKGFAVAHNLVKGDALVLHLTEAAKFKVIIVWFVGIAFLIYPFTVHSPKFKLKCEGDVGGMDIAENKKINDLENFTVTANDLTINAAIPEHVRPEYYAICRLQHSFLHKDIVPGLSPQFVALMISGVVSLCHAIISATVINAAAEHEGWENSLRAYKQFGMNVGFMHGRVEEVKKLVERMIRRRPYAALLV